MSHQSGTSRPSGSPLGLVIVFAAAALLWFVAGALEARGVPGPFPVMLFMRSQAVVVWLFWTAALVTLAVAMLRARRLATSALIALQIAVGLALIFAVPPMPSSDPIAYVYDAQQLMAGADPWVRHAVTPVQAATDPYAAEMVRLYGNPPVAAIYGPAFISLEAGIVAASHALGPAGRTLVQRLVSLAAFVLITLVIPARRRALWALNPFLQFEFALSAHNDAFMLLGLAAAVHWRRTPWSGLGVAFAGLTKLVGYFGLGLLRRHAILVALVASAAVAILLPQALTLGPAAAQASLVPYSALITPFLARANVLAFVPVARLLVFVAIALCVGRERWYPRDRPTYVAVLVMAAIPVVHPWYATWALLFAQWGSRRALGWAFGMASASWLLYLADWY